MADEQEINIREIVESDLPYSQKVEELTVLCNKYGNERNMDALLQAAEALRNLGERHADDKTQAWGILFGGFWHSYRIEYDAAMEVFYSVLPVFERLNDKTGIARIYLNIGRILLLREKDFAAAKIYMEKALAIENEIGNIQGISRVLSNIMQVYVHLKLFREYFDLAMETLPIIEQSGEKWALAVLLNNLAVMVMVHLSDAPKAIELAQRARILCVELGDKAGESQAVDSLGGGYWYLGEAGRCIEYYAECIRLAEEAGNQSVLANRLTNAAYGYMLLNDYEKVLELNLRAKAIYEEINRVNDSGWAEMGIGQALLGMGNAEEALEHNLRAVSLNEAEMDYHGLGYAYFRCGEALVALGRYEEAFVAFNKSHESREHSNSILEIADVQCERGKLLVRFGLIDEAIAILNEALGIAESIGAKAQIHAAHRALSEAYQVLGDISQALYHLQKFITVRDEVQTQASAKKAASLDYLHRQEIQRKEQEATDRILNNILPVSISKRLKDGQKLIADTLPFVTVIFADVVGFTPIAAQLSAEDLVKLLAFIFKHFDDICRKHGLEKIKTIGDAYMAVAGAPEPCDDHAVLCASAALDMLEDFTIPPDLLREDLKNLELDFRIGIHTGSVVAGVIGEQKFAYDLWGDAVNTASRMESHGEPGKIHVSEEFRNAVGESSFTFIKRGEMDIKGKGMMKTYFLEKA